MRNEPLCLEWVERGALPLLLDSSRGEIRNHAGSPMVFFLVEPNSGAMTHDYHSPD